MSARVESGWVAHRREPRCDCPRFLPNAEHDNVRELRHVFELRKRTYAHRLPLTKNHALDSTKDVG